MTCATGRLGVNLQACLMPLRLEVFFFLSLQCFESSGVFMLLECEGCAKADNFLGRTYISLYIGFYKVLKKSYFIGIFRGFMLDSCAAALQSSMCEMIFISLKKTPSFAI